LISTSHGLTFNRKQEDSSLDYQIEN